MHLNADLRNCCDVVRQRLSSACTSHGFDCSKVSFATLRHTPAERKNSKSAEPSCLALIFNKKYETERKKKKKKKEEEGKNESWKENELCGSNRRRTGESEIAKRHEQDLPIQPKE